MVNKQLTDYVNQARRAGKTDLQIKADLLAVGWQEIEVNEALGIAPVVAPSPLPTPPPGQQYQSAPQQSIGQYQQPTAQVQQPVAPPQPFFDPRTVATLKPSAIWMTVVQVIIYIAGVLAWWRLIFSLPTRSSVNLGSLGK